MLCKLVSRWGHAHGQPRACILPLLVPPITPAKPKAVGYCVIAHVVPSSHHPQSRTCSIHIIPNSYCPQVTSSPNCNIPVHFPSSQFISSPIHILPNSFCPQFVSSSFTPLSLDSIPNSHHPMFSSSPVHVVRMNYTKM